MSDNIKLDTKIYPKCSMLIDQNKYIDNGMGGYDAMGHTCYNDAVYSDGIHFYCQECKDNLRQSKGNITKPDFNSVQAWAQIYEIIKTNKYIIV